MHKVAVGDDLPLIEGDRRIERSRRLVEPPLLHQNVAEQPMRVGVLRIERDGGLTASSAASTCPFSARLQTSQIKARAEPGLKAAARR